MHTYIYTYTHITENTGVAPYGCGTLAAYYSQMLVN